MYEFKQQITMNGETTYVTSVRCHEDNFAELIPKRRTHCEDSNIPYRLYKDGKLIAATGPI